MESKLGPDDPLPVVVHVGACTLRQGCRTPSAISAQQARMVLTDTVIGAAPCPICRPDNKLGIVLAQEVRRHRPRPASGPRYRCRCGGGATRRSGAPGAHRPLRGAHRRRRPPTAGGHQQRPRGSTCSGVTSVRVPPVTIGLGGWGDCRWRLGSWPQTNSWRCFGSFSAVPFGRGVVRHDRPAG
ncbi:DUF6233 domain-containing protein [Streptomyces sp. NPDC001393]